MLMRTTGCPLVAPLCFGSCGIPSRVLLMTHDALQVAFRCQGVHLPSGHYLGHHPLLGLQPRGHLPATAGRNKQPWHGAAARGTAHHTTHAHYTAARHSRQNGIMHRTQQPSQQHAQHTLAHSATQHHASMREAAAQHVVSSCTTHLTAWQSRRAPDCVDYAIGQPSHMSHDGAVASQPGVDLTWAYLPAHPPHPLPCL